MSLFPDWRGDALWKCFISKIKFKKLNEFRFVAVGRERGFLEKIAIHKLEKLQRRKTFKSSQNNSFKVEINDKYFESKEQPFTLD